MRIEVPHWKDIHAFSRLVATRYVRDGSMSNASALAYTSLLSLVPLMTVTLAIFSAFPISDSISAEVQNFVFANFMPASGQQIQQYLQEFSSKAGKMTGAGGFFLFVTALMLMSNIDRAINEIWHVQRRRNPVNTFMTYWAILTIGPLLMGASVAISSYLLSLPLFNKAGTDLGVWHPLLRLAPILASTLAFTSLYVLVPNRRVLVRHAITGGFLAALLFESAKRAFGWYLTNFSGYEAIYGALATIPVFLIWIYISWLITLFGGVFTYCLGIYRPNLALEDFDQPANLIQAFRILFHLWQAQQAGVALAQSTLSERMPHVPEDKVEALLVTLQKAQMVLCTDNGRWSLSRDLAQVTLLDLYRAGDYGLPPVHLLDNSQLAEQALGVLMTEMEQDWEQRFSVPLAALFRRADA